MMQATHYCSHVSCPGKDKPHDCCTQGIKEPEPEIIDPETQE